MSNKIQEFYNEVFGNVRGMVDDESNLWLCGYDIALLLGYADPSKTISSKITDLTKTVRWNNTNITMISEKSTNKLVFGSKMKKAVELQDWLCDIVMPTLRKDGMYVDGEEDTKTTEEFDALMNEAYDKKVLRKYGIGVRKDLVSILKESLSSKNPHIYSTATDQLIYKPIFGMTAKQLKQEHNVKSLRDDVFTNEDLVKLAKQEEFVGNLVEKLKDYYKVKEIVYMI